MKKYILIAVVVVLVFLGLYFSPFKVYPISSNINPSAYGEGCRIQQAKGNLLAIDCNSAADGPLYYVDKNSGKIISKCGGYCEGGRCTNCPPKEWN